MEIRSTAVAERSVVNDRDVPCQIRKPLAHLRKMSVTKITIAIDKQITLETQARRQKWIQGIRKERTKIHIEQPKTGMEEQRQRTLTENTTQHWQGSISVPKIDKSRWIAVSVRDEGTSFISTMLR